MRVRWQIHNPRNPLWAFWVVAVLAASFALWPRTLWRRKRGPKLMSKGETLGERYARIEREMFDRDAAA